MSSTSLGKTPLKAGLNIYVYTSKRPWVLSLSPSKSDGWALATRTQPNPRLLKRPYCVLATWRTHTMYLTVCNRYCHNEPVYSLVWKLNIPIEWQLISRIVHKETFRHYFSACFASAFRLSDILCSIYLRADSSSIL